MIRAPSAAMLSAYASARSRTAASRFS
jgi:hypothetical protein